MNSQSCVTGGSAGAVSIMGQGGRGARSRIMSSSLVGKVARPNNNKGGTRMSNRRVRCLLRAPRDDRAEVTAALV